MENRKQVLFIEWSTRGRDFEIDLPLIYFFEKVLGWEAKYVSIFNLPKIMRTGPDLIIMSNTIGAGQNYTIAKLIRKSNFLFFSHVSEGMFKEVVLDGCLWGWNTEKQFHENLSMLWSKKAYLMSVENYNYLTGQLRVSGSLGHDKYKMINHKVIVNREYGKVVGYAAFDFNFAVTQKERVIKNHGQKVYDLTIRDIEIVNDLLKQVVASNRDTLFILKSHPGSGKNLSLELDGLDGFENVMIVASEYSIADVIASSDIWLNYRSSTNLEAWLLGKPSISFCVDDSLLKHTEVCYGSVIENDAEGVDFHIKEFYKTGKIDAFEEKKETRQKLIEEMIGFSDGLNHVRFMSFLKPYIDKIENGEIEKGKWNLSFKERVQGYVKHMLYSLCKGSYNTPFMKKWAHMYDRFSDHDVLEQKKLRYPDFDLFYEKHAQEIEDIYNHYSLNWKQEPGVKA